MENRHLEAVYVTRPVSIAYLTGFHADPHERLMALAVRLHDATLIVPALERQSAVEQASHAGVVAWRDGEDPYELVNRALAGLTAVGVEKDHLSLHAAEVITSRTGVSELVDVGPEIVSLRLIKHEAEIEKLARAAAITDAACDEAFSRLRAGQSEIEIGLMLGSLIGELGGTLAFDSLVQSGPNSALSHSRPSSRKLAPGDFVLLDFGAAFDGYRADTTRMAVVGEPSARHREIHAVVLKAHDAAIAAVRPGATTGDVDAAARHLIDAAGYGERFFHRVGHGLGLEIHEAPSLDPGSQTVLEPGMVFTIEPGIYIPGFGGVRIEDDVVVEDGGCRVLTKADRSLRVITRS
jgi:Xaa-Pro dipeptidase